MASKFVVKMRNEEVDNELPISMIDVVFLLLIFFMCSMQFKTVERKLDAELPKDEGQNPIPKKVEVPTEIRVRIYWANNNATTSQPNGQVIHSPNKPFPDDWEEKSGGVRVPLSIRGAHVVMEVNRVKVTDLNDLARTLMDLNQKNPMPVVIDARMAIPFKWVVGTLDACARAGVDNVKFQSPPAPGGGGSDWWWM